jgi:hypothetical protein
MESSDCIMPSSRKEAPINWVLMCSLFLQFQTASLKRRRSPPLQNLLASAARAAAGLPARKITGSALAAWNGTPLTREASAPHAFTNGLKRSASPVQSGRLIRTGMQNN